VRTYVGHVVDCTDLAPSDIYLFLRGAFTAMASMGEGQQLEHGVPIFIKWRMQYNVSMEIVISSTI
jgi:hypothetical protein